MAATDKATGGRGNGGQASPRVRLVAGVALVGCAAVLTFGALRTGDSALSQPVAGVPGLGLAAPAQDYASDLSTEYDPFVIANSRPRSVAQPAQDYASDLGTEFDPFVISNSQPRYLPTGDSEGHGGPVLP